jgi:hypothetical protein
VIGGAEQRRERPVRNISESIRDAETLGAAVVGLLQAFPDLTVEGLFAAERAEVMDLGWEPDRLHRDTSYLISMVGMLAPIARRHGDLPLGQAFRLIAASGHQNAGEIGAALNAVSERG